jgi:hypothetical protein
MTSDAGSYAWIIRTLVTCREEADRMQLNDLSRLINMAVLQTALDWEGEEPSKVSNTNLEALLRLKMKLAFSERSDNVFVLNSKTAGEANDLRFAGRVQGLTPPHAARPSGFLFCLVWSGAA